MSVLRTVPPIYPVAPILELLGLNLELQTHSCERRRGRGRERGGGDYKKTVMAILNLLLEEVRFWVKAGASH